MTSKEAFDSIKKDLEVLDILKKEIVCQKSMYDDKPRLRLEKSYLGGDCFLLVDDDGKTILQFDNEEDFNKIKQWLEGDKQ